MFRRPSLYLFPPRMRLFLSLSVLQPVRIHVLLDVDKVWWREGWRLLTRLLWPV
jgi:hypothetical protein